MNIKEFAEQFIKAEDEAWQKSNFDTLKALEDPNVVYHPAPLPDMVGWEAHKQYIMGVRQAVTGLKQEWKYLAGEGNLFALSYKARGMFTGNAPGLPPPSNKEITLDYLCLFLLNKGRVKEVWMNGTTMGLT